MLHRSAPSRLLTPVLLVAAAALLVPDTVSGQYFGRNRVQYEDFDWQILHTDHFDIHFYPEEREAVFDAGRMAERWYERFARTFQHEFEARRPIIFYADHPDFQQTNTTGQTPGEATGGFTETLKNRVVMPLTGSYADNDHVTGHELVHAFQFNIAQSRRGGGLRGLSSLPLWVMEGMAEYFSLGREYPVSAMWLRDALRRDDFPTIRQLTRDARFFPYRFGHALWAYIGGEYGDEAAIRLFRQTLRTGWEPALTQVLGVDSDTLSAEWRRSVEGVYGPALEGRQAPSEVGDLLLAPETGAGRQNVGPSISPDGRWVAFLSEKDLFSIDLFLADARTGEVRHRLASAASDPHFDAIRYVESSGAWSPDSRRFAFSVFAEGDNAIVIVDVEGGDVERRIHVDEVGEVNHPAWSPDGRRIAFTGIRGGISDLYVLDLETDEIVQLTDDRHADFHATWSPDGGTIAFSSDRGPETDFDRLTYSSQRISLLDLETNQVRVLPLFGEVRHTNPQFSPDGETLYFLSDQDGFSDVYALETGTGEVSRLTRVATGVSGITGMSPALSVAREDGSLVFSVFDEFQFHIYRRDAPAAGEADVVAVAADPDAPARFLPPAQPSIRSRVDAYIADAGTGLLPPGAFDASDVSDYRPRLALDFIGQPSIGVSVGGDQFANRASGGASAFFSDMLGDRQLGVALQAQGSLEDIGGQVVYIDLEDRWNWAVGGGRVPFALGRTLAGVDAQGPFISQVVQRIFQTYATGTVAYPFSRTRRFEATAGFTRWSFDIDSRTFATAGPGGPIIAERGPPVIDDSGTLHPAFQEPEALNLANASAAMVGDNSFFGFTSPIRGGRWRFELGYTTGSLDFATAIADWRRYFSPLTELTFAVRGFHFGRYGESAEMGEIRDLFVGFETFIRGYSRGSFELQECETAAEGCPVFERLFGQRLAVANAEFRLPLFGTERYGLINFPYIPTELTAFADAGLAWDDETDPEFRFERDSDDLGIPVFSTGVSARFNIINLLILEAYYAFPFQRPEKGWHWGFQVAPGW